MSAVPQPFITPEQYLELEHDALERHEYVNGQTFAMSGASLSHARICQNITVALAAKLKKKGCEILNSDLRVRVPNDSMFTYPDLSIVCGKPDLLEGKTHTLLNPIVLFEVLSPSTEGWDRGGKFAYYRTIASLREYLLVSQNQSSIDRYTLEDGRWVFSSFTGNEAEVQIESVGVSLSLIEVYDDIDFGDLQVRTELED